MTEKPNQTDSAPNTLSGLPFDDFRNLIANLPQGDEQACQVVSQRNEQLAAFPEQFGQLDKINRWLATWSGKSPSVNRPQVSIFAGTHQLAETLLGKNGENATLAAVTHATAGGAAVNQVCGANDIGLKIFDLALQYPIADITKDAALDERGCAATIAFGMEALAGDSDLLIVADMAAGNEVSSLAMMAALWGGETQDWIGARKGRADTQKLTDLLNEALQLHKGHFSDPLEVLRRLGGREHAAIAGAILAARVQHVPVILDGLASLSAASVLAKLSPGAVSHCMIADECGEKAETNAQNKLGLDAITSLGIISSQGTAGAISATIVRSAANIHAHMEALSD